jgi:hypothetical protein
MALKELHRPIKQKAKPEQVQPEERVNKFISKGGRLAEDIQESSGDHRLTLRIPKFLMDKVDEKRKQRVGKISRNLWILEMIEKVTKD